VPPERPKEIADADATADRCWWALVLRGITAIAFGVLAFAWPGVTLQVLVLFFGAYALIRLRREIDGEFWLALGGLISITFGMLVLVFPLAGALGMIWLIGGYAIAFGVCLVALGIRVRRGKTGSSGGTSGMMGPGTGTVPL
jgi:uncharacterized membrane protein HdeD (DUF308 family)